VSNQFIHYGYTDYGLNYNSRSQANFHRGYSYRAQVPEFHVGDTVVISDTITSIPGTDLVIPPQFLYGRTGLIIELLEEGRIVVIETSFTDPTTGTVTPLTLSVYATDLSLTDPYIPPYVATITNAEWGLSAAEIHSGVSSTGPRRVTPGTEIYIISNVPTGHTFLEWETDPEVEVVETNVPGLYTFVMPNSPIAVRAVTRVNPAPPIAPIQSRAVNVIDGFGGGFFPVGRRVEIGAIPAEGKQFTNWTVVAGGITLEDANSARTFFTLGDQDVTVRANFEEASGTPTPPTPPPPPTPTPPSPTPPQFRVGDQVRVNQGVQNWATGEGMPSWVHGRVYPIIEIRTRNGVTQLLLGNGINSWIRATDVTRVSEETTPSIRINDQVRVNQGVQTWATGERMPSWVHGRTYPVIEIRTRSGVTELLLGNGINSWIRQPDVSRVSGTASNPIQINNRVRVNQGVRTWATGDGMPSWVHGRIYPVVEIRTRSGVTELLLGDINSWIRQTDVTKV